MIDFIRKFFKGREKKEEIEENEEIEELTLDDLLPCYFIELDLNEQNKLLVEDGYYTYEKLPGAIITPDQFGKVDPKMEGLGLPIMTTSDRVYISLQEEDFTETYAVKEFIHLEMFDFFINSLSEIIVAEKLTLNYELRDYLSPVEEFNKRKYAHGFFCDIFKTYCYEKISFNEPIDKLPLGAESTNLLSKLWMYEAFLKQNLFKEDRELIIRYLYCRESLQVPNIHAYHHKLRQLVLVIARKEIMLEINDKYQFEQNHPYNFVHSNKLTHDYHSDLIANEVDFDWLIQLLIKRMNASNNNERLTNTFCSRLTKVLNDENCFLSGTTNAQFCIFLKNNFNTTFIKLRPDEAADTHPGREEIMSLKADLNSYRKSKN